MKENYVKYVNDTFKGKALELVLNQMLVEECKKYNQTLIDTKGKEERLPVLKDLFKRITEQ